MRILPVLDLMGGEIVRGVGGRRQEYRRLQSRLTSSSHPLEVAAALRSHLGSCELYLADLDAILGGEPSWSIYRTLRRNGFRLWVDGGIREVTQALAFSEAGIARIVVGLETVMGPAEFAEIVKSLGDRIVFSLDLRGGIPLGDRDAWDRQAAGEVAAKAAQLGVRRLLALDLADVGSKDGPSTLDLLARLHEYYPHLEISAGGGVRNRSDLCAMRDRGVRFALVSSALHDGRLTRADLKGL
jgi:phosphoribosylformimino-5-aminoimidazole carboxamide ribotide isomerase